MKNDVSNRNEANKAEKNETSDLADSDAGYKKNEKFSPDLSERQENDANWSGENSSDEDDAQSSTKRGDDIIVPERSQSDNRNESMSPRGGTYNLRPNPNPN